MEKQLYMLDTNMASYIIKGKPQIVRERLTKIPMANICISAITAAELLRGVKKKPNAKHLPLAVNEFLLRVDILSWGSTEATVYAELRTEHETIGKTLATMDMLIASHAVAANAVLVSNDKAFCNIKTRLQLENWCT